MLQWDFSFPEIFGFFLNLSMIHQRALKKKKKHEVSNDALIRVYIFTPCRGGIAVSEQRRVAESEPCESTR